MTREQVKGASDKPQAATDSSKKQPKLEFDKPLGSQR